MIIKPDYLSEIVPEKHDFIERMDDRVQMLCEDMVDEAQNSDKVNDKVKAIETWQTYKANLQSDFHLIVDKLKSLTKEQMAVLEVCLNNQGALEKAKKGKLSLVEAYAIPKNDA